MFAIALWVISAAFDSASLSFRKKALDNWKLSKTMFKYFAFVFWVWMVIFLNFTFWIEFWIITDYNFLLLWFAITVVSIINTYLQLHVLKTVKLSEMLPYNNLDKLFIVIIWSILYYWTDKETSLITLGTTLLTIVLIIVLTIDFKNIKIPKSIWLFSLQKLIKAITVIAIWFILLKYTNITFVAVNLFFELLIYTAIALILKDSFKSMLTQTKTFYISRIWATILGRTAYIIWLYIIQTSWLIVATLLWFLGIVFNIISMKFILNDSPNKKQIYLAFMVLILIGIWYYFK